MSERVEVGRRCRNSEGPSRVLRKMRELVRHLSKRRRAESSSDEHLLCCGNNAKEFLFWVVVRVSVEGVLEVESVRGQDHRALYFRHHLTARFSRMKGGRRGKVVRVGLLWELVEESISTTKE